MNKLVENIEVSADDRSARRDLRTRYELLEEIESLKKSK